MNSKFPYEQLIAEKLSELAPLPAMADLIWNQISAELDRDMPSDDNDFGGGWDDPDTTPVSPGTGWRGWSLLLLLAAASVVAVYSIRNQTNVTPDQPIIAPVAPVIRNEKDSSFINENDSVLRDAIVPEIKSAAVPEKSGVTLPELDNTAVPEINNAITPPVTDPIPNAPLTTPVIADSVINKTDSDLPQRLDTPGRKRPSGIKGIAPDDYRIVPQKNKKDST